MSDARVCKTCAHLRRYEIQDYDDYGYRCGWRESLTRADFPWAEALMAAGALVKDSGSGIGKRHVEGDWSDVMDCAKWERNKAKP